MLCSYIHTVLILVVCLIFYFRCVTMLLGLLCLQQRLTANLLAGCMRPVDHWGASALCESPSSLHCSHLSWQALHCRLCKPALRACMHDMHARRSRACSDASQACHTCSRTQLGCGRYDNLQKVAVYFPAATNRHGSYLTAFSDGGLQLAVITTLTGFSQMVADQSYWCVVRWLAFTALATAACC